MGCQGQPFPPFGHMCGPRLVAVFKASELYYPHAIHENLTLRDAEATYQMPQMVEKEGALFTPKGRCPQGEQ